MVILSSLVFMCKCSCLAWTFHFMLVRYFWRSSFLMVYHWYFSGLLCSVTVVQLVNCYELFCWRFES